MSPGISAIVEHKGLTSLFEIEVSILYVFSALEESPDFAVSRLQYGCREERDSCNEGSGKIAVLYSFITF